MKNSLTLEELAQVFRSHGIPATTKHLAAAIEDGQFPFARLLFRGNTRRTFLISRAGAEQWALDFVGGRDAF